MKPRGPRNILVINTVPAVKNELPEVKFSIFRFNNAKMFVNKFRRNLTENKILKTLMSKLYKILKTLMSKLYKILNLIK